ncbi:MAG TPA: alpha/beta fold hydrolase [Actinomycetota bacterium]
MRNELSIDRASLPRHREQTTTARLGPEGEVMDRIELRDTYRKAQAARRAVTRALRRPRTYRSAAKEIAWAGLNLAMYPAGVVGEALEPNEDRGIAGRFTPELPLRYLDPEAASTPIVLLHGYFHNRSAFLVVRRALRRAGFRHVSTMNYNVIGHDVNELAEQLSAHVDRVLEETGAHQVHLIGHSLGGLVARAYIQLCGASDKVHTCVTLGSPHGGTYAAWAGRGRAARDLRPGSDLLERLEDAAPCDTRFVAYYSNLDAMIIPASNAKIVSTNIRARNVLVKDLGHMSFLISQTLLHSLVDDLWGFDRPASGDAVTELSQRRGVAPA